MLQLIELIKIRLADQRGATAVEYAMMVGLIALVIVGSVTALGIFLDGEFAGVNW